MNQSVSIVVNGEVRIVTVLGRRGPGLVCRDGVGVRFVMEGEAVDPERFKTVWREAQKLN